MTLPRLALPLLTLPGAILILASLVKPWYVDRYVLYSYAGLALLIGSALGQALSPGRWRRQVPRRAWRFAMVGGAVAVLLAVLVPWSLLIRAPESRKDDVIALTEAVGASARPGDGVLFMPSRRREWALSFPREFRRLDDLALAESPVASGSLQGTELPADTIRRRMLAEREIVALRDPAGQSLDTVDGEAVKRAVLRKYFVECRTTKVTGARVTVYARPGHCGG